MSRSIGGAVKDIGIMAAGIYLMVLFPESRGWGIFVFILGLL